MDKTGRERVRSVTNGSARRQVLLWFDSLWSVHLSQMSSFIIAELYHITHIHEIYSKGQVEGISKIESVGHAVSIWYFVGEKVTKAMQLPVLKRMPVYCVIFYRSPIIIWAAHPCEERIFLCQSVLWKTWYSKVSLCTNMKANTCGSSVDLFMNAAWCEKSEWPSH